jgi:hypothetical protein
MANPWFRLYSEFAHDPKIQMLSEAMQRRYVMLMCLKCSETLETLHETEIAFQLRLSEHELQETKQLFVSKNFIDKQWNLLNWDKRQFVSDSSTMRVAKHRQKKKQVSNDDETLQKRPSNAIDTDTDTDKNQIQKRKTLATVVACPPDVDQQIWDDWKQLRKAKKAPVTETVIKGARKEAAKANMEFCDFLSVWCARGSQGLQADWLKPDEKNLSKTGQMNQRVISGLTRGLIGGQTNVKLLGN